MVSWPFWFLGFTSSVILTDAWFKSWSSGQIFWSLVSFVLKFWGYISVQNGIFVDKPSMPEWYYIALPVLSSSTSTLDTSHLQVIPSLINMACFGFACYWLNRKIFQCTPRFCIQPWSSQARHSQPNFGQSICAVPPQISNIIINTNIVFPMTFILCSILFFCTLPS